MSTEVLIRLLIISRDIYLNYIEREIRLRCIVACTMAMGLMPANGKPTANGAWKRLSTGSFSSNSSSSSQSSAAAAAAAGTGASGSGALNVQHYPCQEGTVFGIFALVNGLSDKAFPNKGSTDEGLPEKGSSAGLRDGDCEAQQMKQTTQHHAYNGHLPPVVPAKSQLTRSTSLSARHNPKFSLQNGHGREYGHSAYAAYRRASDTDNRPSHYGSMSSMCSCPACTPPLSHRYERMDHKVAADHKLAVRVPSPHRHPSGLDKPRNSATTVIASQTRKNGLRLKVSETQAILPSPSVIAMVRSGEAARVVARLPARPSPVPSPALKPRRTPSVSNTSRL